MQTPSKLTKQQKELMRQLSETMKVENTPTSRGLFEQGEGHLQLRRAVDEPRLRPELSVCTKTGFALRLLN